MLLVQILFVASKAKLLVSKLCLLAYICNFGSFSYKYELALNAFSFFIINMAYMNVKPANILST